VRAIASIADFAPDGVEAGVGLALRDDEGCYLFFLAGKRHRCPPGELFYAGIGGHREPGEDWLACAQREAREEIGVGVKLSPAKTTWLVTRAGDVRPIAVRDQPRPLAFYEMIHQDDSPRAGEVYRIVIYAARLDDPPGALPEDEVQGVIALTAAQAAAALDRRATLGQLLAEGARIVAGAQRVDPHTRLYPIGTARALAHILRGLPPGACYQP
jgi:8-oxo-dGTP pyrophosphatase MutT (NUDIX family)